MNTSVVLFLAGAVIGAVALVSGAAVWVGASRPAGGLTLAAITGDPVKLSDFLTAHWRGRQRMDGRRHALKGHHGLAGCAAGSHRDQGVTIDLMISAARGYLRITPAQEGEWRALTMSVRSEAAKLAAACAAWAQAVDGPISQRLALAEQALRQSADSLARLRPAVDALYQELAPSQRRLLDRALRYTALGRTQSGRRR